VTVWSLVRHRRARSMTSSRVALSWRDKTKTGRTPCDNSGIPIRSSQGRGDKGGNPVGQMIFSKETCTPVQAERRARPSRRRIIPEIAIRAIRARWGGEEKSLCTAAESPSSGAGFLRGGDTREASLRTYAPLFIKLRCRLRAGGGRDACRASERCIRLR